MPTGQPFTVLCRGLAELATPCRADLHIHTTVSDGTYTPQQVVDVAQRAGLAAIAITDHDALDGSAAARAAAKNVEIVNGVEITSEYEGLEVHVLGYFINVKDRALRAVLERLRCSRRQRFHAMAHRLRDCGVVIDECDLMAADCGGSLGRRTLATLLYAGGQVGSVREAFDRFLADGGPADIPKERLPFDRAIALVHAAGGVTSLAHPRATMSLDDLTRIRSCGLQAVEVEYPTHRAARSRELREWASRLGMAITGGSDCHGPEPLHRGIGCRSVTIEELEHLRELSPSTVSPPVECNETGASERPSR